MGHCCCLALEMLSLGGTEQAGTRMRGSVRREGAAARVKAKPLGDEGTFFFFYYCFKLQVQRAHIAGGRFRGGGEEKHTEEGAVFLPRRKQRPNDPQKPRAKSICGKLRDWLVLKELLVLFKLHLTRLKKKNRFCFPSCSSLEGKIQHRTAALCHPLDADE